MKLSPKKIAFFYHPDNKKAAIWAKKIKIWLGKNHPDIKLTDRKPEAIIVLGGDGTILQATRQFERAHPMILGLNLGTVGFLASAREPEQFIPTLNKFLLGNYVLARRMMLSAEVVRKRKKIFRTNALNEIAVQNLLGVVEAEVDIEGYTAQFVRGSGLLIATATGSTAYNLSAHGPIVMPDIKCLIITELLDHNLPTPSMVVGPDKKVSVRVISFQRNGALELKKGGRAVDTVLIGDGDTLFPLQKDDVITVKESSHFVEFVEFDPNYFLKSLKEKFAFK